MFIPTPNRKAIHTYLFNGAVDVCLACHVGLIHLRLEGVVVIKKNYYQKEHEAIPVPNIQVMKALQSLKSRGYVSETFSWQYYYYILTEEGITFLRAQLNLPESVVPATIAKAMKAPVSERPTRGGKPDLTVSRPACVSLV
jgi:small subunit ribosomal protein S10e